SHSDATTVNQVDLAISKSHSGNFAVGTNGTYTITVRNVGSGASSGTITVTDSLPNGLSYVLAQGSNFFCSSSGQTVTCTTAGSLPVGASAGITITVSISDAAVGTVTNSATISGGGDTNSANNTANDPTTVNSPPTTTTTTTSSTTTTTTPSTTTSTTTSSEPSTTSSQTTTSSTESTSTTTATSTTTSTTTTSTSTTTSTTSTTLPPSSRLLVLESKSATPGSTVSIAASLSEGNGIAGLQFTVNYDPAVLSYPAGGSVTPGTLVTSQSIVANGTTPGKVSVALAGSSSLEPGSGTVVSIPLAVSAQAVVGTSLTLSGLSAFDPSGVSVPLSGQGSTLTITAPSCRGDVNLDGQRNTADAIIILNYIVGRQTLTGQALTNADVNQDGEVNVGDVILLLNYIVGNSQPPACR
ncbi:MAG: DUF11 domain-containing protein, partial [Acidobacteria bacterium]|nr:DUF11 domain-containing protein [Acidobacteriota bacterium]